MDGEEEINEMQMKNQTNLNQVTDMSLRCKADLQITKNKLTDVNAELRTLSRQINDKSTQLDTQRENITKLTKEKKEKQLEIDEKDNIINQREKNILHLKKKTQELEKFKFVLDEKI